MSTDNITLLDQITSAVNSTSAENISNTPDFIIGEFLVAVLDALDETINKRERWYDRVATGDVEPRLNKAHAYDILAAEPGPSAALYAFAAWLTCRDEPVTFGTHHDAAVAAKLVGAFCDSQGWTPPVEGWEKQLKPYPKDA